MSLDSDQQSREESARFRDPGAQELGIVELSRVDLSFPAPHGRAVQVLNNVTIRVDPGEFVAVLGPSGCGKSTLLRVVAGLLEPTAGKRSVMADERSLSPMAISMNFQRPVLLPWLTVVQNSLLPFELTSTDCTPEIETRLVDLLRIVGLNGFRDSLPGELSGGMQMRAEMVRTFITDPKLLLMDEPFSALDEVTRNRLGIEFRNLTRESGAAVMFVTHSIQEAIFLADRIVLLSPRPAHVVDVYDIDLPEERAEETRRSTRYLDLCAAMYRGIAHG